MSHADIETAGRDDLATTTLAEIYAQQGLHERALEIYERLAERAPDDAEVRARIEALSAAIESEREAHPERETVAPPPETSRDGEDAEFERWLASR